MDRIIEYKCPRCGGTLEFSSELQTMQCPYCESTFSVEELRQKDDVLDTAEIDEPVTASDEGSAFSTEDSWGSGEAERMGVYSCKSCRGEIVADDTTAATKCPYCGNPVMLTGRLSGELKPDLVIPFKLNKEAAKQALKDHMKGKKLLPKTFSSESTLDEIQGLYVPYWLVNADCYGSTSYSCTNTRTWSDSNYRYTETKYYDVDRSGYVGYDNIPCDASEKMSDDMMESIEPYDVNAAAGFQTAYLSGYIADRFDVSSEESVNRAQKRIFRSTKAALDGTVRGYSSIRVLSENFRLNNASTKYALLPVWLMNVTWNGGFYTFAMNGQTGKIVGDLPLDKKLAAKYWLLYSLGFGLVFAVISVLTLLL